MGGTIRRNALHDPLDSVFWIVYNSNQNEALIQLCRFHKVVFDRLAELITPLFYKYIPHAEKIVAVRKTGRKRILNAHSYLGLVLAWLYSRGTLKHICWMLGLVKSQASIWLCFGKRIVTHALLKNNLAKVKMPTDNEAYVYSGMIQRQHPTLEQVWGTMDGVYIDLQICGDHPKQAMYYNKWQAKHYITNLFVFSPDGKICACMFNIPGTIHDSRMAHMSGIYNKIKEVYERTGCRVFGDSAFAGKDKPYILKLYQKNWTPQMLPRYSYEVFRAAVSLHQSAEWGMRELKGS